MLDPAQRVALLDELRALERELHREEVRCDRSRLSALLHPEFHEIGRSGRRYDHAEILDLLGGSVMTDAIESWDYELCAVTDDVAVLIYRSEQVDEVGRRSNTARRSSVWQRTPGGWQLRFHQATPL